MPVVSNCKSRNTFLRACRETERRRFFFDTQNSSRSEWQLFPSSIHAVIPTIRFVPRHNVVFAFMKFKGVPHLCDFRLGKLISTIRFIPRHNWVFAFMNVTGYFEWDWCKVLSIKLFPSSIHAVIPTIRFVPRHNVLFAFMKFKGVPHLCDFH